jgi:hypothetical protein
MSLGRRTMRLGLAVGFFVGPILGVGSLTITPAYADGGPSFDALANAYGVSPTVTNGSLPLGLTVEGSGPVAQAHLNSIGNSDAFASTPYPGDTVAGLPGTAGAIFSVPIPAYPLIVTTQSGDAPKSGGLPGISLQAASYPAVAEGKSTIGTDLAGFTSSAEVASNQDDSVTAHARTTLGVNLLNLITLSGVDSSATVTADGNTGQLTRSSHLSIGQISVPGLSLNVPPDTPGNLPIPVPVPGLPQLPPIDLPTLPIPLGGTLLPTPDLGFEDGSFTVTLPLIPLAKPMKFAVPAEIVLKAFETLGIKITYEAAENNSTGVVAPALTFAYTVPDLPKNDYFSGPTPVKFMIGRSTASVTLHPAVATPGTGTGGFPSGPTTAPPITTPASGGQSVDTGSVAPVASGNGAVTPPTDLFPTPVTGTGSGTGTPTQDLLLASSSYGKSDLSGIYLICMAIAGAVLAAAMVLKTLGVRLLWGS